MPSDLRRCEAELGCQGLLYLEPAIAKRGEGSSRARELDDKNTTPKLAKPFPVPPDHREPHGSLVAKRDRQRVLQVRTASHDCQSVLARQRSDCLVEADEIGRDDAHRLPQLQDCGSVHDVLGGRAPVEVASGLSALPCELMYKPHDRIADEIRLPFQLLEVDRRGIGPLLDLARCLLGNDPEPPLYAGKRDLDPDGVGYGGFVREDAPHFGRAESVLVDEGVINSGWHFAPRVLCSSKGPRAQLRTQEDNRLRISGKKARQRVVDGPSWGRKR